MTRKCGLCGSTDICDSPDKDRGKCRRCWHMGDVV